MTNERVSIGRRCRPAQRLVVFVLAVAATAGCGAPDRPSTAEWSARWTEAQAMVPTEQELVASGGEYCDRLLAQLRSELPDLVPGAVESIDPVIEAWIDRLRTLAFECPSDPSVIQAELSTLHEFESEISAVLP